MLPELIVSVQHVLRCYVRKFLLKNFALDDWFMLLAQIILTPWCAVTLVAINYGLGQHTLVLIQDYPQYALLAFKWQIFGQLIYIIVSVFVKLSIAILLLRLSPSLSYRIIVWASASILTISNIAGFILILAHCIPFSYFWDRYIPGHEGRCMPDEPLTNFGYFVLATTILNVQLTLNVKIFVIVILGLGIFASIATSLRLKDTLGIVNSADVIYDLGRPFIWNVTEIGQGIIAACMTTLRPLTKHIPGFSAGNQYAYPSPTGTRSDDNPQELGTFEGGLDIARTDHDAP